MSDIIRIFKRNIQIVAGNENVMLFSCKMKIIKNVNLDHPEKKTHKSNGGGGAFCVEPSLKNKE